MHRRCIIDYMGQNSQEIKYVIHAVNGREQQTQFQKKLFRLEINYVSLS